METASGRIGGLFGASYHAWKAGAIFALAVWACHPHAGPQVPMTEVHFVDRDSMRIVEIARRMILASRRLRGENLDLGLPVALFRIQKGVNGVVRLKVEKPTSAGSIVRFDFRNFPDTLVEILDSIPREWCIRDYLASPISDSARIANAALRAFMKGPANDDKYGCATLLVRCYAQRSDGSIEIDLWNQDSPSPDGGALVVVDRSGHAVVRQWREP